MCRHDFLKLRYYCLAASSVLLHCPGRIIGILCVSDSISGRICKILNMAYHEPVPDIMPHIKSLEKKYPLKRQQKLNLSQEEKLFIRNVNIREGGQILQQMKRSQMKASAPNDESSDPEPMSGDKSRNPRRKSDFNSKEEGRPLAEKATRRQSEGVGFYSPSSPAASPMSTQNQHSFFARVLKRDPTPAVTISEESEFAFPPRNDDDSDEFPLARKYRDVEPDPETGKEEVSKATVPDTAPKTIPADFVLVDQQSTPEPVTPPCGRSVEELDSGSSCNSVIESLKSLVLRAAALDDFHDAGEPTEPNNPLSGIELAADGEQDKQEEKSSSCSDPVGESEFSASEDQDDSSGKEEEPRKIGVTFQNLPESMTEKTFKGYLFEEGCVPVRKVEFHNDRTAFVYCDNEEDAQDLAMMYDFICWMGTEVRTSVSDSGAL